MAIESLFDETLAWHPGLTDEQIMEAQSRGIYEPTGPEYEQFLASVGVNPRNLDSKSIVTQEPVFIENEDKLYDGNWHPDLTQEQILYALSKEIYEPVGQEYEQFLAELGLEPVKEVHRPVPPPPKPIPTPKPIPIWDPKPRPIGDPVPGKKDPTPGPGGEPVPGKKDPTPGPGGDPVPGKKDPIPGPGGDPVPGKKDPTPGPDGEPVPGKKDPTPGPGGDPVPGKKDPIPGPREYPVPGKEEPELEEDTVKVVRLEKREKSHIPAILMAAALAGALASGLSIDRPLPEPVPIVQTVSTLDYGIDELVREMVYEDRMVESTVLSFAAKYGVDIGGTIDLGTGVDAYFYGNLTGNSITLSGEQVVTGFCLYSPENNGVRYEFSFYEDRDLNGASERKSDSVEGIEEKVNLSLDEFLAQLDTDNYNLEDIGFSLHFGNRGWVDFSDLIKVNPNKITVNVPELVEVIKKGASYEGTLSDADADFINIAPEGKDPVWVPITDEDDNLLAPGTVVQGSDGKEYVLSELSLETTEVETLVEGQTDEKAHLKWSIMDCELAIGIAPMVAAAAFAIANKLKNEKNKENPDFFEFENEQDYRRFKSDFEKAREEYRNSSKFGQVVKRIFLGEEVHIATDLSEEQVQELYSTIRETHNADYSYDPTDQIRFRNGQVYAYHKDGTHQNITDAVAHIGKDNTNGTEGRLTPEIVEEYGGGAKK